jgi:hypothetical protein
VPAVEQLNIRVTPETKQKFRTRAQREGMTQQQLLEALLKMRGTLPAPDPVGKPSPQNGPPDPAPPAPKAAPAPKPDRDEIDFAVWMRGRTGIPLALLKRAIRSGRVTVAGVPWTGETISPQALAHGVAYDGRSV